jgi:hypothetical protein
VTGEAQAGESATGVFLFPANRARWPDARQALRSFLMTRTSGTGAFQWTAVPPGEYLLVAIRDADAGDWPDAAFLSRLALAATPVKIASGQQATVTLRVSVLK